MKQMSLGNKLTCYLLLGVLTITGLDLFFSLKLTRENLLNDVRREVTAISRTLQLTLAVSGDDAPARYFSQLAPRISHFENILGVVFYDDAGRVAAASASLLGHSLPQVDVSQVISGRTPVEGLFNEGAEQRYYRVEPLLSSTGTGIAAFLILEDFPFFHREVRGRMFQALVTMLLSLAVLALIVSVVIRQSVTQPLRAFTHRIKAIGQGRFNERLRLARDDEIGELAEEFDCMSEQLDDARRSLITENEQKLQLERALRHSEKLAAVGQIASRLAHEIGTPLNVIQMRAEQLLQRETQSERDRAFLNVIVAQIERISRFIRQLLTLARRSEAEFRALSLNTIAQRVWETMGHHAGYPGVEVSLDLEERLPLISGDIDQLQQVVLNLTVNAMQAVSTGGQVCLRTRFVKTSNVDHLGVVELLVTDTGPGIPVEDLPRIFDPFFTTKDAVGGTGLGLAISREIVLTHRGEIRVESELGKGSRFIVELPLTGQSLGRSKTVGSQQPEERYVNIPT